MRINSVCVLLATATALHAVTVSDPRWGGIQLQFATKVEPGGEIGKGIGGGVFTGSSRPHRLIYDAAGKRYFGYDLNVTPKGNSVFELRIEPLGLSNAELQRSGADPSWARLSLPTYPVVPAVRNGDTLAIDLLVNLGTGQKIVDYITLRQPGFDGAIHSGEPARDFKLEDVSLDFMAPRVRVNGNIVEASTHGTGGVSGPVIWFYVADRGRYIMSLLPNEKLGFQKAGVVASDGLTFKDGDTTYRVDCSSRIVPAEGIYNLYVMREPGWRPRNQAEVFQVGALGFQNLPVRK